MVVPGLGKAAVVERRCPPQLADGLPAASACPHVCSPRSSSSGSAHPKRPVSSFLLPKVSLWQKSADVPVGSVNTNRLVAMSFDRRQR